MKKTFSALATDINDKDDGSDNPDNITQHRQQWRYQKKQGSPAGLMTAQVGENTADRQEGNQGTNSAALRSNQDLVEFAGSTGVDSEEVSRA